MDSTRELWCTLDINDAFLSCRHGTSHSTYFSKAIITHIVNGKTIDLTDGRSLKLNDDIFLLDHFFHLLFDQIDAVELLLQSFLYMGSFDDFRRLFTSQKICLNRKILECAKLGRQIALIRYKSTSVLNDRCNSRPIKRQKIFFLWPCRYEINIMSDVTFGTRHLVIKMSLHFEDLGKIFIHAIKHMINLIVANQDNFNIKGNRFRPKPRSR